MDSYMKDNLCEQAASYALGALDGDELVLFERHLEQGCGTCETELNKSQFVINQLCNIAPAVTPPSSVRSKLLARIQDEPLPDQDLANQPLTTKVDKSEAGLTFIKATDGLWQELMPGILLKPLSINTAQNQMTALVRMAPGATYPPHRHTTPEEFYCLEGTCFIGGQLLYPGDYHRAEIGTIHHETSTKDGCLILGIFSPNNEMLDPLSPHG